ERLYRQDWTQLNRVCLRGRLKIPRCVQVLELQLGENCGRILYLPRQVILLSFTSIRTHREILPQRAPSHNKQNEKKYLKGPYRHGKPQPPKRGPLINFGMTGVIANWRFHFWPKTSGRT